MMKQNICLLATLFVLLLVACIPERDKADKIKTVKADEVVPAGNYKTLKFPGLVKAAQDVKLSFRISGVIQSIQVTEGTHVRAGDLLAELEPTDYQVQLDATEAEYKQIKAEAERVMALYKENGVTPNENDKAVYGLKQITAKYQHHKDQLGYTKLYAPFDGVIQKKILEEHETVGAGMPILSMIGVGNPEVEIHLPAVEYVEKDEFNRYTCTFDIFPNEIYQLKPIGIAPKANANQLYTMRLRVLPGKSQIPSPGMNTMVTIECSPKSTGNRYSVPSGALLQQDNKTKLFVIDSVSSKVHLIDVQMVMLKSDGMCIVESDMLKSGMLVVSAGVHRIQDGEEVKVLPVVSETNVGGLL